MNKVLNQDEIDDLKEISKDTQSAGDKNQLSENKVYNLASQDINIYTRIQNIGLTNERFSKDIKSNLSSLFKKPVEVNIETIDTCKFDDYLHSLSFPTSINHMNVLPINGVSLLVMDSSLVFCLVENYFGGEGKCANKIFDRNFTASENRIIKLILEQLIKNLREAWAHVLDVQFVFNKSENDPSAFSGIELNETMVISKFKIDINQIGGEFHVCYTAAMIDHIRDFVTERPTDQKDKNYKTYLKQIQEALVEAKIDLYCVLAQKKVSIGDVVKFKKGDIIPIEIPMEMTLSATNVPLYKSNFGTFEGKYAAKIIRKIKLGEEDNYGTK